MTNQETNVGTAYVPAMWRALEIALLGPEHGPNPQVGAVIVDENNEIVGEGWHQGSGTAHAEVMALESVAHRKDANGKLPAGFTAVVTLEPCNHTGKTGPCAEALIAAGITRVVYAVKDPGVNSANGAATLRAAGIEVIDSVLADRAELQGKVWLTSMRKQRPFVTLKWASTLDGRAAANDGTSKWITGQEARHDVHLRRSNVDAIIAGTGTILADDAQLSARLPQGGYYPHQPLRVVIGQAELAKTLRVFDDTAETVQFKTQDLGQILTELFERGVRHAFVEGGPTLASAFIEAELFDRVLVYQAPLLVGGQNPTVRNIGASTMADATELEFIETKMLGKDILLIAEPKGKN